MTEFKSSNVLNSSQCSYKTDSKSPRRIYSCHVDGDNTIICENGKRTVVARNYKEQK